MRKYKGKDNKPTTIIQALYNRSITNTYRFVISGEDRFYEKGNVKIPAIEFESLYPTDVIRLSVKGDLIGRNFS
ncbi:MAG: hypothetical protein ABIP51_23740 [Bacteroidia bacterium]